MAHVGGGGAKPTPSLDQENTRLLNLTVLQRLDPAIEEILITAGQVTLYQFGLGLNQWSRKDVEGSLFVVKRNTQPRFQFIVMNRLSTENLVEDLLGDFEYELQPPYILYRNSSQEVNGLWFYNSQDCDAVGSLFNRILSAYSKVPPKAKIPANESDFPEHEAVPTLSEIEGPLEPTPSAASAVPDIQEDAFIAFFNGATRNRATSNVAAVAVAGVTVHPHQPFPNMLTHQVPSVAPLQPTVLRPAPPLQVPPVSSVSHDAFERGSIRSGQPVDLVKPSLFNPVVSSQLNPTAAFSAAQASPALIPLSTQVPQSGGSLLQYFFPPAASQGPPPYGTPLLQPYPPPNPSPSLTPATYSPLIAKDKVRDALLRLVQSDSFVDMIYREINKGLGP